MKLSAICVSLAGSLVLASCTGSGAPSASEDPSVQRTDVIGEWGTDSQPDENDFKQHVTFTTDGAWSGSLDGCNAQNGKWQFDPSSRRVTFTDMASTLRACVDPETGKTSMSADGAKVASTEITLLNDGAATGTLPRTNSPG